MSHGNRPPWVARWLLRCAVPADARDTVLGDLEEVYRERLRARGAARARAWFWLQSMSFSARFTRERMGDAISAVTSGSSPSWLDVKLGIRMLRRSPLLTVVGCIAIATAIGIFASFSQFFDVMTDYGVELPGGDRVVTIVNRDIESGQLETQNTYDLARWRESVTTIESIGAVRQYEVNIVAPDGGAVPVQGVELTAGALALTGFVPDMGRPLQASDEVEGAEPVVILSHDLWQSLLGADPDPIGTTVKLGETPHTVVAIAPPSFGFPLGRKFWVPMRLDPRDYEPRSGPSISTIGVLAPGRTLADAENELAQLHTLAADEHPDTHALMRPVIAPFRHLFRQGGIDGIPAVALAVVQLLFIVIMFIACVNVATLVFAQNAARAAEITVRGALGASRSRIVTQMFVEGMVLAFGSAVVGLIAAGVGFDVGMGVFWEVQRIAPPDWFHAELSSWIVLKSLVLAAVGAGVIGVLPALRATRSGMRLQLPGSDNTAMQFGRLPTAVIVVQVALSVAVLPLMLWQVVSQVRDHAATTTIATDEYLSARLRMDATLLQAASSEGVGEERLARYHLLLEELRLRLESEPGVRAVSYTSRLPGITGMSIPRVLLDIDDQDFRDRVAALSGETDAEYWEAIDARFTEGRGFQRAEFVEGSNVAIVNQAFVTGFFAGRSAVGRLVRPFDSASRDTGPPIEIVGVVPDEAVGPGRADPVILFPLVDRNSYPLRIFVHLDGDPAAFGPRLRSVAADTAPDILVDELSTIEALRRGEFVSENFFVVLFVFVAAVTVLLSVTGIYALMSFIVAQRTREIGIRTALGADARLIIRGVFARALAQLAAGALVGVSIASYFVRTEAEPERLVEAWITVGCVALLLIVIGMIGCLVPMMRGLRLQPTEALRVKG